MNELISRLPEIDRASIYRTIELFLRLGIVERIQIGWKYKIELSAAYSHHHHHMTCISCGEVLSFEENHDLERVLDDIASHSTFRPTSHQIEIRGYCKNCQIKK
jgi:Fur family ferric uptake transcriptional regulator